MGFKYREEVFEVVILIWFVMFLGFRVSYIVFFYLNFLIEKIIYFNLIGEVCLLIVCKVFY